MARRAEGWRLRPLTEGRKIHIVRFTHNGRTIDRSTRRADKGEARKEAAKIYADFVQREPAKRVVVRRGDTPALEELVDEWLEGDTTVDPDTAAVWEIYGAHWAGYWPTLVDVSDASLISYRNKRLTVVLANTVRKELSAVRRFLGWCQTAGYLQRQVIIPKVGRKVTGTRYRLRRRVAAPDLTPAQVAAFLAALPVMSSARRVPPFPIRDRFVVAYETGLRPGTLDGLSAPDHYAKGDATLRLTDDIDKIRWGRELPLSDAARAALDRCVAMVGAGLIFGKHDYDYTVAKAASASLPPAVADRFCGAHLRSARGTHLLEESGNLPGVQFLFGHKHVSTTARYIRPSFRAAVDVLNRGRAQNSGDAKKKKAR